MLRKLSKVKSKKRILITGGSGFIGSHLVEKLVRLYDLVIFDNFRRDALSLTSFKKDPRVRVVKGDVLDFNKLTSAIKKTDIVIHLAAVAGVSSYEKDPLHTLKVDAWGTYNVLKAASENNINQVIIASSSEVYGPYALKVSEVSPTQQGPATESRWSYSVGKLVGDHFAFAFSKMAGLNVTILRPFNIYGPRQIGEGAIQTFISNALRGKPLVIRGNGSQTRAWCYIDDCVSFICALIDNKKAFNQIFNIGNPELISVKNLALKIITLSKSKSKLIYQPHAFVDIRERSPKIDKAKKLFSYKPTVSLDQGLLNTIIWFEKDFYSK